MEDFDEPDEADEPRISRRLWAYAIGTSVFALLVIVVFYVSGAVETVAHTGCWIHEPPASLADCLR
jgi:hypothetical protein